MASDQALPEKITQMQCSQTNTSLESQFMQWLAESFKYKPDILNFIEDELQALLGYAGYKLTIAQDKAQPGDYLQNISFKPLSKKDKVLWLVLSVLLPYIAKKITNYASTQQNQIWKTIYNAIIQIQKIINVLQFINYAIFIWKGDYRSLTQRILKIKMSFLDPENKRILNFSLMNRMLVWQVYEFFLKSFLPNAFALFLGPLKNIFYLTSYLQIEDSGEKDSCIYCSSNKITMPHEAVPCRHKACYYCLQTNSNENCKLCSKKVDKWNSLVR